MNMSTNQHHRATNTKEKAMNKHQSTINSVVQSTRGMELWAPLLTRQMEPEQWSAWLNALPTKPTRSGNELSPARQLTLGSQFAMSNLSLALRAAMDMKGLPYAQAARAAKSMHDQMDHLLAGFAALRGEARPELVMADVTLLTQSGFFDDMVSQSQAISLDELLEAELGDYDLSQYEDYMELGAVAAQSELRSFQDRVATDEGEFVTALHEFKQLADIEPTQIKWAEFTWARVGLVGVEWPTDHPLWGDLLQRLVEAWANTRAYLDTPEEIELHDRKVERRLQALEGLHGSPAYARWAMNHLARRVWRDIQVITGHRQRAQERVDQLVHDDYIEERYGTPVRVGRHRDEGSDLDREQNLLYRVIKETELCQNAQYDTLIGYDAGGNYIQTHIMEDAGEERAFHGDLRFQTEIVTVADELLPQLRTLHARLREMEKKLAPLWSIFQRNDLPDHPPLYWNLAGYYYTEEEARAAYEQEINLFRERVRADEGDALAQAAALLKVMNG